MLMIFGERRPQIICGLSPNAIGIMSNYTSYLLRVALNIKLGLFSNGTLFQLDVGFLNDDDHHHALFDK